MTDSHAPFPADAPPYPPDFFGDVTRCRACGCHDFDACVDENTGMVCWWIEEDLCSACAAGMAAEADPAMAGLHAEDAE